ncbi:interleukin-1 receptor-like 2 [Discoglossus pictus]
MMSRKLVALLLNVVFLALHKAEICDDAGGTVKSVYASEGQPVYISCPLEYKSEFNVTWHVNETQTEVTSDTRSRIHQDENLLKFFPARLKDAAVYVCVLRNSTNCIQKQQKLEVFENDEGLCYNKLTMYHHEAFIEHTILIKCQQLDPYFDVEKVQIKWFKECQPLHLNSGKYYPWRDTLNIYNATLQDQGNYTCEATHWYNGTEFTISRAIDCTLQEPVYAYPPTILIPTNNVVDAELGSTITLNCTVISKEGSIYIFWHYNDTEIDENYTYDERVTTGKQQKTLEDDKSMISKTLTFSKVKEEDYNRKIFCAVYSETMPSAYVILKHPDPNFQGPLIAIFISMVFVLVTVIVTCKIFTIDIVLWYRSSCFAQTNRKVLDGKIYDAYIMYPRYTKGDRDYDMDIFVQKMLPEVLERQCAYRLFIFGRDELPGRAVADLIDETISQSRRLIIILGNTSSHNHLGDDFEQQIAMYESLIQNKLKVILIELKKISDYTNMPESIKYIKQKQGVVRWKGDFTESSLSPNTRFWKNIRYRMPPTQGGYLQDLDYVSSEHS